MNNDQIRIAIAECCGWKRIEQPATTKETWGCAAQGQNWWFTYQLPNYPADLNAMHEAEKALTPEQEEDYVSRLSSMLMSEAYDDATADRWKKSNLSSADSTYRATAYQRAEAFLKVKGLWKV